MNDFRNQVETLQQQLGRLYLDRKLNTGETQEQQFAEARRKLDDINDATQNITDTLASQIETSRNYHALLDELMSNFQDAARISDFKNFEISISNLLVNTERVRFLLSVSAVKGTTIIVGANGSGKSTFVNSLASSSLQNITVIPAQKALIYVKDAYNRAESSVLGYQRDFLTEENLYVKNDLGISDSQQKVLWPFTFMITALVNDYAQSAINRLENPGSKPHASIWERVKQLWNELIPEISFTVDSSDREIKAKRDGRTYSVNGLSDGEKCILFYIGNVLLAKNDSYIVVDEPETFLNPAIYNRLWDSLIHERKDCQFVFTSHNVDFINGREHPSVVWCKKFSPPNTVELKPLQTDVQIPAEILTELLGSRKKILFCEGTRQSYDYHIFSALYGDRYTVIPVGGHGKVIDYTKTFNDLPEWVGNSAAGIIDNDGLDQRQTTELRSHGIYSLPYNEIEMLLIDKEVLISVLRTTMDSEQANIVITEFQSELFKYASQEVDRITYDLVKKRIDSDLHNGFIDATGHSLKRLVESISNLPETIDAQGLITQVSNKLDSAIAAEDYDSFLKMCTLKREVTGGLANRLIQSNFADFTVGFIQQHTKIRQYLRAKISLD